MTLRISKIYKTAWLVNDLFECGTSNYDLRYSFFNLYLNYLKYLAILIMIIILFVIKHIRSTLKYIIDQMRVCLSFEKVCFFMSRVAISYIFQRITIKQELKCISRMLTRNPEQFSTVLCW